MNSKQFNETISQEMGHTSNDNGTRSFLADILDTNNPENIAAANFRIFIGVLGCFLALLLLYLSCVNSSNQEDSSASVSVISLIFYTFFFISSIVIMIHPAHWVAIGLLWGVCLIMPALVLLCDYYATKDKPTLL